MDIVSDNILFSYNKHIYEKIGKIHRKNVKIEDFLGKFYRYMGGHMKTIRNKWKKEETFSDKMIFI